MKHAQLWTARLALLFVFAPAGVLASQRLGGAQQTLTATVGTPCKFRIPDRGGHQPLKWRLSEGELPPGIKLSESGTLEGLATDARREPYEFIIEVSDSWSPPQISTLRFALTVMPEKLRITLGNAASIDLARIGERDRDNNQPPNGTEPSGEREASLTTVRTAATPQKRRASAPEISSKVVDGVRSVSGFADPSISKVEVTVRRGGTLIQREFTDEISENGTFTAKFDKPLATGDVVAARAVEERVVTLKGAGKEEVVVNKVDGDTSEPNPTAPATDWGRVRANFAFGFIFSRERSDFSERDPYLDFRLDYNWLGRTPNGENKGNLNVFLNSFFETRFATIPDRKKDGCSQASSDQSGGGSQNPVKQSQTGGVPGDEFLCSPKAATAQIGLYAPIHHKGLMSWNSDNVRNAVFVAPLVKAGVHTITSSIAEDERNLRTFWSAGLRFGHHSLGPYNDTGEIPSGVAPQLISYLDITLGKWQNFEFKGLRRRRAAFEGRLKIPSIPIQLGFDANVGKGPDDLRFLVATDFNVGDFFKKLLANGQ